MTWLAIFVPSLFVVIALTLVELRCGRDGGDWRINLQNWAINLVAGVTVYGMFTVWHGPALIDGASLPFWLAVPIYVVVQDLGEYLFHRAQHAIPLLWTMHSLHHSDPDMSALTSTRHFWGDRLIKSFTVWPLAYLVISPTSAALATYFGVSLWHFLVHSNLRLDFGRWTWLLNGPAYHRIHHSRLPEHYNCNFASLFPIFDILSGSYRHPDCHPVTGLEQQPPMNALQLLVWPIVSWRFEANMQKPAAPVLQAQDGGATDKLGAAG
jgi:sterol desaturase/sphingolipid hydroxylase (fatty acid hydroxylase superfamily)